MDKKHILDEIRRTAEANGGKPLGKGKFFKETGIKFSDWYGIHWVRWGDAVAEAGYPPNQMQVAYSRSSVIEKYIAFIREIGHIPVHGELRIKRLKDSAFPSKDVFSGKNKLLEDVVKYCRRNPGHDDIIKMCEEISKKQGVKAHDNKPIHKETGFVYLFRSGKYYKIGRSNHPGRREYEMKTQMPENVQIVHQISTDDPIGIEAYWHNRFASKRKRGEWFDLDSSDISDFKRRKFM
jgi:hypothetical protein